MQKHFSRRVRNSGLAGAKVAVGTAFLSTLPMYFVLKHDKSNPPDKEDLEAFSLIISFFSLVSGVAAAVHEFSRSGKT